MESDSKNNKADNINLVDKTNKMYVRIKLSEKRDHWERWVSYNKKNWTLDTKLKSLEDVLKTQQNIIDNNYLNFYQFLSKK